VVYRLLQTLLIPPKFTIPDDGPEEMQNVRTVIKMGRAINITREL